MHNYGGQLAAPLAAPGPSRLDDAGWSSKILPGNAQRQRAEGHRAAATEVSNDQHRKSSAAVHGHPAQQPGHAHHGTGSGARAPRESPGAGA